VQVKRKVVAAAATLVAAPLLWFALPSSPAAAHGTMSGPSSRVFTCYHENPENPVSAACKAAVAAGGTQALYDWNEVSLLDAGGQSRTKIPDGKLCSAGRDKYRGLDLLRGDWPATAMSAGSRTISYTATAPHANSNFEFYITRAGWNPTLPLKWSDLVLLATFNNQNPTAVTSWTVNIPQRTGRQLIYSIWQRVVGSTEAFYTCSDVDFGGGPVLPNPPPTTPPTTPPPTTPPTTPPPVVVGGTWAAGTAYHAGDQVTYAGLTYRCLQPHTAIPGWEPPNVASLWQRV
jgi:predicted carbohydrate-binding protein with CBM5 and CBM33 domain